MTNISPLNTAEKVPSPSELVSRARALIPTLRARSMASDAAGRLPDETIQDIMDAGLFRVLQPKRWGGYEMSPKVFYDVQMALSEGDMSVGWVYGVVGVHNWQMALFDDRAAQDVWGAKPNAVIASSYMPKGKTVAVDGGYKFSGRWQFSSGCKHADWFFLGGLFPDGGEGIPGMGTFLIPKKDTSIIDTWDVAGLKGTGSNDVVVNDVFVPAYRTHTHMQGYECASPGNEVNTAPLYRLPFGQVFLRSVSTASIGALQAMLNEVIDFGSARVGSFGGKTAEDPFAQFTCANVASQIGQLKATLYANFDHLEACARDGITPDTQDRLRFKMQSAEVSAKCGELAATLYKVAGGNGLFNAKPFARILSNILAGGQHQANNHHAWAYNYGAVMLGRENKDIFL